MSTATRRDEVDEQNEVDAVPGLKRCGNRQSMPLLLVSFVLKVIRVELGLRRLYLHRQDASFMLAQFGDFHAKHAVQFE